MGSVSNARAIYALQGTGTHSNVNVDGSVTIGVGQTQVAFTGADIAYSFTATATGSSQNAIVDLDTGTITASATITGSNGEDFEGATLPTMVDLLAVLVQVPAGNTSNVSATLGLANDYPGTATNYMPDGFTSTLLLIHEEGITLNTLDALTLNLGTSGDAATVTIIGKSS